TTTEADPGERHVYTMPIEGGARTRLTPMTGGSSGVVSPDERTLGLIYSYSNKPPEVYVMPITPQGSQAPRVPQRANASSGGTRANGPNGGGVEASARQVTTSPSEEWRSFKWADPQVITFKARDGVDVHA